jgi:hypothetical protein
VAKDKKRKPAAQAQTARPPAHAVAVPAEPANPELFSLKQYLLMNVIFDVFCILQLVIVKLVIHETRGLYFFFGLLMLGFLAVSIFDYVYDRYIDKPEPAAE